MEPERIYIPALELQQFCSDVFVKAGVSAEDAAITSEVLLAADLRGIDSHGAARLQFYLDGLQKGWIKPGYLAETISETSVTALIDAGGGMGPPVAYNAMQLAIHKAEPMVSVWWW